VVVEGSSGIKKEDIQHVVNDTVKNLHSSICLIDRILKENLMINFTTMSKVEAICIQSSNKYLTLSITFLEEENPGKYVHIQRRHASIPLTFEDRYEWITLFELISYFTILLEEQNTIRNTMMKERNRLVTVDGDKTVGKILSCD
jgi:hypothetical protein